MEAKMISFMSSVSSSLANLTQKSVAVSEASAAAPCSVSSISNGGVCAPPVPSIVGPSAVPSALDTVAESVDEDLIASQKVAADTSQDVNVAKETTGTDNNVTDSAVNTSVEKVSTNTADSGAKQTTHGKKTASNQDQALPVRSTRRRRIPEDESTVASIK
jgi:hypothetical protein